MLPFHTPSGTLPPYIGKGDDALRGGNRAPYVVTLVDVVARFATTPRRVELLDGFFSYRAALREARITAGFQWLNGSFTETKAEPGDIDVVTFYASPQGTDPAVFDDELAERWPHLFTPSEAKKLFQCDTYGVGLSLDPRYVVGQAHYWYGVWSHDREGGHKGFVEVDLAAPDAEAIVALSAIKEAL